MMGTEDHSFVVPTIKGFTVDVNGTEYFEDAISITKCSGCKSKCHVIGYHISAAKEADKRIARVPDYYHTNNAKSFIENVLNGKVRSLKKAKNRHAISIYFHTAPNFEEEEEPPVKSSLNITNKYSMKEFEGTGDFKILWNYLKSNILQDDGFYNFVLKKEGAKASSVVQALARIYAQRIGKYLQDRGNCWYISKRYDQPPAEDISKRDDQPHAKDNVYVQADTLKEDQKVEDSGLHIISSYKYLLQPPCMSPSYPDNRAWIRRVMGCGQEEQQPDTEGVWLPPCTSPGRKIHDFINQQILIRKMNKNDKVFYSKEDLDGVLCIRYSTPVKTKAVVGLLSPEKFNVSYVDVRDVDHSIKQIFYNHLGGSSYEYNESKNTALVKWEYPPAPEQEALSLELGEARYVTVTNDAIAKLQKEWEKFMDGKGDTGFIQERKKLLSGKTFDCLKESNGGLELELRPRTLIRLQISPNDSKYHEGIGLRMLLIGPNCNVCLAHVNEPKKVFMSDREDLQQLLPTDRIEELRKSQEKKNAIATVLNGVQQEIDTGAEKQVVKEFLANTMKQEGTKARTSQVTSVQITWKGIYNGEGSFRTEIPLSEGDLLCIRKDLADYVWNAHAIVVKKEGDEVTFAVCTLSQTDVEENGEFVVEIIR